MYNKTALLLALGFVVADPSIASAQNPAYGLGLGYTDQGLSFRGNLELAGPIDGMGIHLGASVQQATGPDGHDNAVPRLEWGAHSPSILLLNASQTRVSPTLFMYKGDGYVPVTQRTLALEWTPAQVEGLVSWQSNPRGSALAQTYGLARTGLDLKLEGHSLLIFPGKPGGLYDYRREAATTGGTHGSVTVSANGAAGFVQPKTGQIHFFAGPEAAASALIETAMYDTGSAHYSLSVGAQASKMIGLATDVKDFTTLKGTVDLVQDRFYEPGTGFYTGVEASMNYYKVLPANRSPAAESETSVSSSFSGTGGTYFIGVHMGVRN